MNRFKVAVASGMFATLCVVALVVVLSPTTATSPAIENVAPTSIDSGELLSDWEFTARRPSSRCRFGGGSGSRFG